jgi:hypothetical protein
MKTCAKCNRDRLTDGGVQMTPVKWICQSCWVKFSLNRK